MSCNELEPGVLWLEFGGAVGDQDLSEPFTFIRLLDAQIEGGDQHELIGWLQDGQWVEMDGATGRVTRIAAEPEASARAA